MEQEAETGGIDECSEIAGKSLGSIPPVQTDASAKDASAKDVSDHGSDEDGSDHNDGKILSSQNSSSGRQRIIGINRDFIVIGKLSLKLKPDEQKGAILRIFQTEMNKAGVNFDKTDPGNWEDCTKLGGWTRTYVRKCICTYIRVYYEFRSSQFEYELFL